MEHHAEKPGASQSADEGLATGAAEFAGFCGSDDEKETEKQGFTLSYIKTVTGRPNGY